MPLAALANAANAANAKNAKNAKRSKGNAPTNRLQPCEKAAMVVLAQRPLPVRRCALPAHKPALAPEVTKLLPGECGLRDCLACRMRQSPAAKYKRWFESGTLLIKEFQQGDHSVISLAALAAAALAALAFALGGILLKRRALGTSLAHRAVLGKCRFSNSNQLFQRFHRNSVKTRTLSPAASSNSNSNERELGKLEAPKPHKSSRVRVNSITSSSSTRSRLRPWPPAAGARLGSEVALLSGDLASATQGRSCLSCRSFLNLTGGGSGVRSPTAATWAGVKIAFYVN